MRDAYILTHIQACTHTHNKNTDIHMYYKAYVSCFHVYSHKNN